MLSALAQPLSYSILDEMEKALAALPPLSPSQRVAVYVARRTCVQLCSFLEGIEPLGVERHAAIALQLTGPLAAVVRPLAEFKDVSFEQLAALIQASEAARVLS